jgi:hypothetical protein
MATEVGFIHPPAQRWEPEEALMVRHVETGVLGLLSMTGGLSTEYKWIVAPFTTKDHGMTMYRDNEYGLMKLTTTWIPLSKGSKVTLEQ